MCARIRIRGGNTNVWNRGGERPAICDVLERIARFHPSDQQGIKVLGTPLGHVDFVAQHLRNVTEEQQCLLERFPTVQDVQSVRLLLLHCAAARANFQLRSVHADAVEWYARSHDENIWQCLWRVLHIDLGLCSDEILQTAALPLILGGIGLRRLGGLSPNDSESAPRCGRSPHCPAGGTP